MKSIIVAAFAAMLALPLAAPAHTSVAGTTPKSGSVLKQSPPSIEIAFRSEARLTSVVVVDETKTERKLDFTPKASAVSFKISNPNLEPGRNEIQWKALSKDGHVVSGNIVLTVESKAH